MKFLYKDDTIALALVGSEYRLGKPAKDEQGRDTVLNPSYYYRTDIAVKHLAKKVSNETAADLWEWLTLFNEICDTLKADLAPDAKN